MYDVPPDPIAPIAPGGPPVTVSTTVPGQNAWLTFTGAAGAQANLNLTNSNWGGAYTDVYIYRPDGSQLVHAAGRDFFIGNFPLSQAGTYSILIDPPGTATGRVTVTLQGSPGFTVKVTGLANIGETATAFSGAASPPATSWTYQWQRCDVNGAALETECSCSRSSRRCSRTSRRF